MAEPTIALRFRDTTNDVDTIAAHRDIIKREGAVWWGWWKKTSEPDHAEYLARLPTDAELTMALVDRTDPGRQFRAVASRWSFGTPSPIDAARVPEYYREKISEVHGWFLLKAIDEEPYNEWVGAHFAENTFARLDHPPAERTISKLEAIAGRDCILHLSDLHFGADYGFLREGDAQPFSDIKTLTQCVLDDLKRRNFDRRVSAVLITGDFTTRGDFSLALRRQAVRELEALVAALGLTRDRLIPLPGNHDFDRYPVGANVDPAAISVGTQVDYKHEQLYRVFVRELLDRALDQPVDFISKIMLDESDVLIAALNSCRVIATEWTEYGFVGPSGIDIIERAGAEPATRPTLKMVALHHHLLPVARIEAPNSKGVSLSLDSAALLDAAQRAGFHLAVHGHQHIARLARYETLSLNDAANASPIIVVSSGSASAKASRRLASERNSYCIYEIKAGEVRLIMRELRNDGQPGAELFDRNLGLQLAQASTNRTE